MAARVPRGDVDYDAAEGELATDAPPASSIEIWDAENIPFHDPAQNFLHLTFVAPNEWHGFRNRSDETAPAIFGYLGAGSLTGGGHELPESDCRRQRVWPLTRTSGRGAHPGLHNDAHR
jgi:hypothetical protein